MKNLDYGLAILKPDGVKENGVYEKLKKKISQNNLQIVNERKRRLNQCEVLTNFASPFDEQVYANYLSSSEVIVFLVQGENASSLLRKIKIEFRNMYGFDSKTMENLLHTADNGNEYMLQFSLFFPELNIQSYTQYADMNLLLEGYTKNQLLDHLTHINNQTNLKYIGLISNDHQYLNEILNVKYSEELNSIDFLGGYIFEFFIEGEKFEMIGYLKNFSMTQSPPKNSLKTFCDWIKRNNGLLMLNYTPYRNLTSKNLLYLKEYGLDGVHVYDARRTLKECEIIEDVVELECGLLISGGSGEVKNAGVIALGKKEFEHTFGALI